MNATSTDQNESIGQPANDSVADLQAEYARVELMGHRQRIGQIQEVSRFGVTLLRVDFWDAETDGLVTEFYAGSALYCVSPCDKSVVDTYIERQKNYQRPAMRHLPAPDDDPYTDDFDENGHRLDEDDAEC